MNKVMPEILRDKTMNDELKINKITLSVEQKIKLPIVL